jgi:hypothetical protein
MDAAAWHSAWGKMSTPQIAHPTSQKHLGSARTIYLDYRASRGWNKKPSGAVCMQILDYGRSAMRGILLWLIGAPIPIIILLYLFDVI